MELYDRGQLSSPLLATDYDHLMQNLASGFDFNFNTFQRGWYFSEICEHPDLYLQKATETAASLRRLQASQSILIVLITNSLPEYAAAVLDYVLGADWRSYFDFVIHQATKPRFWTEENPFTELTYQRAEPFIWPGPLHTKIGPGSVKAHGQFMGGNAKELELALREVETRALAYLLFTYFLKLR